jgi:hypothetical protein
MSDIQPSMTIKLTIDPSQSIIQTLAASENLENSVQSIPKHETLDTNQEIQQTVSNLKKYIKNPSSAKITRTKDSILDDCLNFFQQLHIRVRILYEKKGETDVKLRGVTDFQKLRDFLARVVCSLSIYSFEILKGIPIREIIVCEKVEELKSSDKVWKKFLREKFVFHLETDKESIEQQVLRLLAFKHND